MQRRSQDIARCHYGSCSPQRCADCRSPERPIEDPDSQFFCKGRSPKQQRLRLNIGGIYSPSPPHTPPTSRGIILNIGPARWPCGVCGNNVTRRYLSFNYTSCLLLHTVYTQTNLQHVKLIFLYKESST